MRKRKQKGSLQEVRGMWIARWWEQGRRCSRRLGLISELPRDEAQATLDKILAPLNQRFMPFSNRSYLRDFVANVYLPLYRRKWKKSSAEEAENRIKNHIVKHFGDRSIRSFAGAREELQVLLDRKAEQGLSHSVVDHLRWDLHQIFGLAVAEGMLEQNPAALLFTPRNCRRPDRRIMMVDDVRLYFSVLELRARLISELALFAGLRPGEIFALTWNRIQGGFVEVRQRVYRGIIDSPKTFRSIRRAALCDRVMASLEEWRSLARDPRGEAWVFPSENGKTSVSRDNCWRRDFEPQLATVGLEWATFQVLPRTHCSLLGEAGIDPQIRAEQMGHSVDVNMNVYTKASEKRRRKAVNVLDRLVKKTRSGSK